MDIRDKTTELDAKMATARSALAPIQMTCRKALKRASHCTFGARLPERHQTSERSGPVFDRVRLGVILDHLSAAGRSKAVRMRLSRNLSTCTLKFNIGIDP